MEHSQVVLDFLFPADQQPPEPVQPGVGAFDDPVPRSVAGDLALLLGFFPTLPDVGCIAPGRKKVPEPEGSRNLYLDTDAEDPLLWEEGVQ
jgi:hypothetical protein